METELLEDNSVDSIGGGEIWENSCNCHCAAEPLYRFSPNRSHTKWREKKKLELTAGYDGTIYILSRQVRAPLSLALISIFINLLSHTLFDNRCPDGGDTRISFNAFSASYIINRRQPNWIKYGEWLKAKRVHTRKKELNGKCGSLLRLFSGHFSFARTRQFVTTLYSTRLTATALFFFFFFFPSFFSRRIPTIWVLPIRTTATETHCAVWVCGATVPSSRAMKVAIICHGH